MREEKAAAPNGEKHIYFIPDVICVKPCSSVLRILYTSTYVRIAPAAVAPAHFRPGFIFYNN